MNARVGNQRMLVWHIGLQLLVRQVFPLLGRLYDMVTSKIKDVGTACCLSHVFEAFALPNSVEQTTLEPTPI